MLSTLSTFALAEDESTVVLRPNPAKSRDFGLNQNIFRRDVTGDGIPDVLSVRL